MEPPHRTKISANTRHEISEPGLTIATICAFSGKNHASFCSVGIGDVEPQRKGSIAPFPLFFVNRRETFVAPEISEGPPRGECPQRIIWTLFDFHGTAIPKAEPCRNPFTSRAATVISYVYVFREV